MASPVSPAPQEAKAEGCSFQVWRPARQRGKTMARNETGNRPGDVAQRWKTSSHAWAPVASSKIQSKNKTKDTPADYREGNMLSLPCLLDQSDCAEHLTPFLPWEDPGALITLELAACSFLPGSCPEPCTLSPSNVFLICTTDVLSYIFQPFSQNSLFLSLDPCHTKAKQYSTYL